METAQSAREYGETVRKTLGLPCAPPVATNNVEYV